MKKARATAAIVTALSAIAAVSADAADIVRHPLVAGMLTVL